MGIIRAVTDAVSGALADQWLEVIEPDQMSDRTVFTAGVQMRPGRAQLQHQADLCCCIQRFGDPCISQSVHAAGRRRQDRRLYRRGGLLHRQQFLRAIALQWRSGDSVKESFNRVRFGGTTPYAQKVFYVNLQEIKGIKFGTTNPVNYFDSFYNSELFLRAFGTYSIKVVDPIKFYTEAIPKNAEHVDISDINEQYLSEFLGALQGSHQPDVGRRRADLPCDFQEHGALPLHG